MTEAAQPTGEDRSAGTPAPRAKKAHAASGARILTAGLAAGAGLGLVGVMGAAAGSGDSEPSATPIRRVVVVDRTAPTGTQVLPGVPDPAATPATAVAQPEPLPLPPLPDAQPAPPVTESQGS